MPLLVLDFMLVLLEDQNRTFDPETEDVLKGRQLKNGMRVLREDSFTRRNLDLGWPINPENIRTALKFNRWCTVTNFEIEKNNDVSFIGVYDDGTKATHIIEGMTGWFVKLDSILESQED